MEAPAIELPVINERNHAMTLFVLRRLERRLNVHFRLHGLHEQFAYGGGIIAANHFTRLETFVIPFIMHRALGITVRILAAPMLFENKAFGKYLTSIGAVPANYPNKYELVARDILRGGWWLIFPEGSMIKDRKVVERGDFYVATESGEQRRRPRSGVAIFALTVQHYKDALRLALQRDNETELLEICTSLGLTHLSTTTLAALAYSPTAIVPLNVTYYPLNPQHNALKSFATRLMPELPHSMLGQRIVEELMVEGSMLLKGVETDFRLGDPLVMEADLGHIDDWRIVPWSHSPWRQRLTRLRQWRPLRWHTSLLDRWAAVHTWRQRRKAWHITRTVMQALYTLTTVNIDHLLSALLLISFTEYKHERFVVAQVKRRLYLIIQALQALETAHLHSALTDPDLHYLLLTDTTHPGIESFVQRAEANKLLTREDTSWILEVDQLSYPWAFTMVRLGNFMQVCCNEIEPLTDVMQEVRRAIETDLTRERQRFRGDRFAYEERLYEEEYAAVLTREQAKVPVLSYGTGRPVLLEGSGEHADIGVLLVHGYSASPGEMLPLAQFLNTHGFTVYVVRLRGHGTSPSDLHQWTWQDWYHSVRRGYHSLRAITHKQFVGGMSTGGAMALYLASHQHESIHGVFAVGAPIKLQQRAVRLAPMLKFVAQFVESDPQNPLTNYSHQPLRALQQLTQFINVYKTVLGNVTQPALLLQARGDTTVRAESAQYIYDALQSPYKHLVWKDLDRHVIVSEHDREVHHDILTFLHQYHPRKQSEE